MNESRQVLVLGAGLISPPLLRYFLDETPHQLVVAADEVSRAERIVGDHPRGRVVRLDVSEAGELRRFLEAADVVVSLLPARLTPGVARVAIETKTPVVNTSYAGPEMRALDQPAREAGVLILAECGADPGLDHMSALRLIRRLEADGMRVVGFSSCAGGLPARDDSNNPWGYKFSWSPRAALVASGRPARYLERGSVVDVPGDELFGRARPYLIDGLGRFEVYPNSDALAYRELYGLLNATDLFRGTLRYPGWAAALQAAHDLGMLDEEVVRFSPGTTYAQWLARRLPSSTGPLAERLARWLGCDADADLIRRFEWAGLLSERLLPTRETSSLDVLTERLGRLLTFQPGERDMVVIEHRLISEDREGSRRAWVSRFVSLGEPPDDSAMGHAAALPAALAACRVVSGEYSGSGLTLPTHPDLYEPILEQLEKFGLIAEESEAHRPSA